MTEPGLTDNYSVADHVNSIVVYISLLDFTAFATPLEILFIASKYTSEKAIPAKGPSVKL